MENCYQLVNNSSGRPIGRPGPRGFGVKIKASEMMVPRDEYATVFQEAYLAEAVLALEEAQERFTKGAYKHRAILVIDDHDKVVGKLSQTDIIRGIELGYKKTGAMDEVHRLGFSSHFIKMMTAVRDDLNKPMDDICRKAADIRVKEVMQTPGAGEYINQDADLDQAIHQLVTHCHQSLLVINKEKRVVGVLRLTDVFHIIAESIKACRL